MPTELRMGTGGRKDPRAGQWTPLDTFREPAPRGVHVFASVSGDPNSSSSREYRCWVSRLHPWERDPVLRGDGVLWLQKENQML